LKDGETVFEFNSFQGPWGNSGAVEQISFNAQTGVIEYVLPKNCIAKTRIGYPNGSLVRTIGYGIPKKSGFHSEKWDGYEQSGKMIIKEMEGLTANVLAYGHL